MTKLSDLGERRILREIIPRYVAGAGDDCAVIQTRRKFAVLTTDPVPRPAAEVIGKDTDPYWLGWLLVTINASDVAASGARPDSFLAHLDLPSDYDLSRFERLLQGISDSCRANGLRYAGGNLREAKAVGAVGTALGVTDCTPLTRKGAGPGCELILVGVAGQFWIDAFKVMNGIAVQKESSPLYSPISQAPFIYQFHEAGLIQGAMDTSDGLAPTLEELARVNQLSLVIDIASLRGSPTNLNDPRLSRERLSFGWGDWTVACIVRSEHRSDLAALALELGVPTRSIGKFGDGPSSVYLRDGEATIRSPRLESERFAEDSWFAKGIDAYIAMLEQFRLP